MEDILYNLETIMIVFVFISLPIGVLSISEFCKGIRVKKDNKIFFNIVSFIVYNIIIILDLVIIILKYMNNNPEYVINLFLGFLYFLCAVKVLGYIYDLFERRKQINKRSDNDEIK